MHSQTRSNRTMAWNPESDIAGERKWRAASAMANNTNKKTYGSVAKLCVCTANCALCMWVACFDFSLFIIDCKLVYRLLKAQLCCSCHWFSMPSSSFCFFSLFSCAAADETKSRKAGVHCFAIDNYTFAQVEVELHRRLHATAHQCTIAKKAFFELW